MQFIDLLVFYVDKYYITTLLCNKNDILKFMETNIKIRELFKIGNIIKFNLNMFPSCKKINMIIRVYLSNSEIRKLLNNNNRIIILKEINQFILYINPFKEFYCLGKELSNIQYNAVRQNLSRIIKINPNYKFYINMKNFIFRFTCPFCIKKISSINYNHIYNLCFYNNINLSMKDKKKFNLNFQLKFIIYLAETKYNLVLPTDLILLIMKY